MELGNSTNILRPVYCGKFCRALDWFIVAYTEPPYSKEYGPVFEKLFDYLHFELVVKLEDINREMDVGH